MKNYIKILMVLALILTALRLESCSSSKGSRERASINGTVFYRGTKDSVTSGTVKLFYNDNLIQRTLINNGKYFFDKLSSGCCYTIAIQELKKVKVLGIDSLIELDNGENERTIEIDWPSDTLKPDQFKPYIEGDTNQTRRTVKPG